MCAYVCGKGGMTSMQEARRREGIEVPLLDAQTQSHITSVHTYMQCGGGKEGANAPCLCDGGRRAGVVRGGVQGGREGERYTAFQARTRVSGWGQRGGNRRQRLQALSGCVGKCPLAVDLLVTQWRHVTGTTDAFGPACSQMPCNVQYKHATNNTRHNKSALQACQPTKGNRVGSTGSSADHC